MAKDLLKDVTIRNTKPTDKDQRLNDGGGLYILVKPSGAEWGHIDLEVGEWRYLVTKTETQHIVPLSSQAVKILTELKPLTGHGRFVFPSEQPRW